ncbi:MAG: DNA-directed RNA polymerase [Thermococci archaeon]|nr:DNA-directed RNA polymerase [Thermococci archaeon]
MYRLLKVRDVVRIPPRMFTMDPKEAAKSILRETYEGWYDKEEGVILAVMEVEEIKEGIIVHGDGATYHEVTFTVLTWKPFKDDVVEGEVVDAVPYGAFIRIGPMDGLVHVSQLMDDYVVFDEKNRQFLGKESRRVLKVGDHVRARIISISAKSRKVRDNKISLTMRQPGLGKLEWIEAEKKKEN